MLIVFVSRRTEPKLFKSQVGSAKTVHQDQNEHCFYVLVTANSFVYVCLSGCCLSVCQYIYLRLLRTAKLVLPRLFIRIEMNTAFTSLSLQTVLFMSVCRSVYYRLVILTTATD